MRPRERPLQSPNTPYVSRGFLDTDADADVEEPRRDARERGHARGAERDGPERVGRALDERLDEREDGRRRRRAADERRHLRRGPAVYERGRVDRRAELEKPERERRCLRRARLCPRNPFNFAST